MIDRGRADCQPGAAFEARPARFIRVRARSLGQVPDWHPAKGGQAWLFADEIVVEKAPPGPRPQSSFLRKRRTLREKMTAPITTRAAAWSQSSDQVAPRSMMPRMMTKK
jgi:hypothetical protein